MKTSQQEEMEAFSTCAILGDAIARGHVEAKYIAEAEY
jgi:hypothetical protein